MELRHLVALSAIGRTRSFSRAADELGYTQSAVSQQVARLERAVGRRLVERRNGAREVGLTTEGALLVEHADAVVAQLNSARADLAALADGTAGTVRIGCYQSVGARLLPRMLHTFMDAWPHIHVELHEEEDDARLLDLVESGSLDLTFVVLPMPAGPFAYRQILEDPYVAVVAADSTLGDGEASLDPRELTGRPLATYGRMRDVHAIEHRLGHPELARQIRYRSNDNATIVGLAAEHICTGVVAWLSVDPSRSDVRAIPLRGVPPRTIGIAWHRDRYRAAAREAFVRIAQQEAVGVQSAAPLI